ncbi:unnamed protein product [Closterium sp. NIES-54]
MYALSVSADGDRYRCVPPDPGIVAAALGASESGTLPGTAPIEALHTFTLNSRASRCFFRDKLYVAEDVPVVEDVGAASARAKRCSSKGKGGRVVEVAAGVVVGGTVEVVEAMEVVAVVGLVAGVGALVAAVEAAVGVVAVAEVGLVAVGLELGVEVPEVARGSSSSVGARLSRPRNFTCGRLHTQHCCFSRLDDACRAEFGDDVERPRWTDLLRSGVAIFDLDFDVILSAMYALSVLVSLVLSLVVRLLRPLHIFTLDSGASRCFFRDSTTLTPLPAPVLVRLANPSGGLVVARSSTVLLCPALPSGSLSSLQLPSFSTDMVSTAALHDTMVTTTTPGGQCVSICTCTRTGRYLDTFTHRPGSILFTLATEPPQVAASTQVSTSDQVAPPCSCRLLSHQTLQWHHRLGHPSLPRLRGMHSRLLVSGLPRSLPTLPPSPGPPCLCCVEGRQHAAPHSSSFPLTTAPLQTLHMSVGGEFSSDLLWDLCRGEGILQSFTLPTSPQQNGIAERRIGLVMEVTRTSMIHAAAPHFLWPFAVRYAAHQLNLWPRVYFPKTSPTLSWTGKVGDASVFRVWGSRAFVRDTSTNKLSVRAIPCVFLGFTLDVRGWQFYHPTSRRVFPSQDVTFDKSVPFYRLFPYRFAPPPPPPLFLALGPPPVAPLPPEGPSPCGVSQVNPLLTTAPVEVADGSGAARGAVSDGAASGGAEPGVAKSEGAGSRGAEPGGEEPGGAGPVGLELGGAESKGSESGGAEPQGAASSGGPAGASPRLSLQQLREWLVRRARLRSGATGAGGAGVAGAGGAGVTTGAAGTGGVGGAKGGDPMEPGAAGDGAGGTAVGGTGVGGTGAGGTGAGAVDPRGTVRPQLYSVPLHQKVLGVLSSASLAPPLLCPPPD